MPEIISLKEARAKGFMHFFSGKPCKYGHIDVRYVRDHQCRECCRRKCREQMKRRRSIDPEGERFKVRESYHRNKEKRRAAQHVYNHETLVAVRALRAIGILTERRAREGISNRDIEKQRQYSRNYYWNNRAQCLDRSSANTKERTVARRAVTELGIEISTGEQK